jgi:hypothetical protein
MISRGGCGGNAYSGDSPKCNSRYAYNKNAYCIPRRHVSGMIISTNFRTEGIMHIMKVHIVS